MKPYPKNTCCPRCKVRGNLRGKRWWRKQTSRYNRIRDKKIIREWLRS